MSLERRKETGEPWKTVEVEAAGATTQTATVTTDPDTFIGEHVFDLGRPSLVWVVATLVSASADGETFGSDPGEISVDVNNMDASDDGVTFAEAYQGYSNPAFALDEPWLGVAESGALPQVTHKKLITTPRYVRVLTRIQDSDFNVYAGANNPTGQFRVDIESL